MNKQWVRPKKGRIIAGVAKGIADRFGLPVMLVRFIWILLLLPGGVPGIIPYIVLWLLLPSEDTSVEIT
jgi:phage shock protein PspC (stress-responsive transcriptional regulator)